MKLYSRGQARRSILVTAGLRVLSQLASLASYVVLVRGMAEQSFGVLSLFYSLIPLISTALSLGIEQTLRRYQPEYLQAAQFNTAAWLLRVAASTRLVTNLVVLGAILLSWQWVAPLFKIQPYRAEFMLFCVLVTLHFQATILQLSLASHMLQGYGAGMTVVLSIAKLLAYLVLIKLGNLTLVKAILADTLAYGLMYLGLRIAHVKHCAVERAPEFRVDPTERRRLLRYSIFNNFNDAGTLLLTSKSDNFFIAALMNPLAVGAYSFYTRLSEMTSQLSPIRQFSNVIQPLFFAVPAKEAEARIPRYFTLLLNLTMVVQLPILVYATAYHAEIVAVLFAGKFIEHSWLLPAIVGFATIARIGDPVGLVAQYQERAALLLLSKVFGVYYVVAILALVPVIGLYGAVIATGTTQLMKNLFLWWHVRHGARWTNFGALLAMIFMIWGGAIVTCYALKTLLHAAPLTHLVCGALVCIIATIVYVRSPALSASDRQILGSVFHGREQRLLSWMGLVATR